MYERIIVICLAFSLDIIIGDPNYCWHPIRLIGNIIAGTDKALRKIFNIKSDKSMRRIIQNIRENKKFILIVGSQSGKTGGFFICKNNEEIIETINNIKHRANQMYRMCYVLEWKKEKVING